MVQKRKACKEFVPLGRVLDRLMKSYARQSQQDLRRIWQCWEAAVGTAVAQNTRPAQLRDGRLVVNVASPAWLHQLQFLKRELIDKLNRRVGKALVEDIRFRIGNL